MTFAFNDAEWRMTRLEKLGLKEDPFKLSADPRYLYLGRNIYRYTNNCSTSSPAGAVWDW